MLDNNSRYKVPWALIFTFLAITIIISITGFYIYNIQKAEIKSNIYSELSFISKTKLENIIEWRNNRLDDAYKIEGNLSFIYDVQKWLSNRNDKGSKQRIEKLIEVFRRDSNYTNIYLIDNKLNIRIAWGGDEKLGQFAKDNLSIVSKTKKILFTDLYRADTYSQIHLDLIIPLILTSENKDNLIGMIMIRIVPNKYLYPVIQSWPTPSKSAETLLIRREQNQVLFLNELRHKKNTAFSLTAPISDTLLPAVKAVLGYKGIFEGIDYRGVRVLADLLQIPGTNWFMVTKVDLDEIYSPLREKALMIFLFSLALIIIAFAVSVTVWRHQRSVFYREKYKLETERKVLEKHFSYLIKNANDIILLLNEGGKIIEANDRALSAYGYTRDEFLLLNINDIRCESSKLLITEQMNDIASRGGLIFETTNRKKDGTTFPVEVSSRSIEIDNAVYYQSIVRDITERKQADKKIERLNRIYALLSQVNQAIVRAKEREKLFNEICEIAIKFGKFNLAWFGLIDYGKKKIDIVAAFPNKNETIKNPVVNYEDKTSDVLVFEKAINTGSVTVKNEIYSGRSLSDSIVESDDFEFRSVVVLPIKFEDKVIGIFTVYSSEANYFDTEQVRLFEEVGMDISFALENIKAGQILYESETKFKNLYENAPVGIVMIDEFDKIISINKGFENIFQYKLDEIKGRNVNEVIIPDQFEDEARSLSEQSINGFVIEKETIRKRKDGSLVNVYIYGVPVVINNQQAGIYGMYLDITERKIAETNLRENQKLLSTVVETMPVGIWLLDTNGAIMHGNTAAQKIWAGAKYVGVEKLEEYKGWFMNTGKKIGSNEWAAARCLKTGESIINEEVEIECFDGQHKIILNSAVPIIDSYKKIAGVINVNQDITERKRIEKQLEEERNTLHTLINALPDRIYFKDKECRFLLNNIEHIKALGCKTQEEVLGKTDFDFRSPELAQKFFEDDRKVMETGKPLINRESNLVLDSGKKVWLLASKVPLKDDKGNIIGLVGVSRDITERKLAEEALIESEDKFRSFAEESPNMIFINKLGRVVYVNRKCVEVMGYSREEFLNPNFNFLDLIAPEYVESVKENFASRYRGDAKDSYEYTLITKDKKRIEVSLASRIINYEDGKAILGNVTDISERKKTETALIASEERNRAVTETAADAIITINTEGKILSWNKAAENIFDYSSSEMLGKNLSSIIPQQHKDSRYGSLERLRNGAEERLVGKTIELTALKKNGAELPIELSLSSWVVNHERFYTVIIRDITERKLAEEEIRKLYRGVEQSPATVVITDTKGNIEYVNAKFVETTGYTLADVIGNNPRILKSGEKPKEEYKELWKTILAGNEWRGEFHNKKKNGELYWELASISPIKNEKGVVTHFIAIKEDITDRKRMIEELILAKDKAEKSEKLKTEFLAQMSHEIRTPINIILGFNSFIKEELKANINEELSESFDSIHSASKRIMRTVDMILNMSEVQTKTVTATPENFDLDKEVLSILCAEFRKNADRKNLSFLYKVETNNTKIFADNYLVTHIFTNLIDNAVKYTDKGKVEIIVNRNEQNKLYVEVKDSGIGISKEFLPSLFDAFTQEEHGYSRKYEGNGLGLALVKNYCELNNAQIEVESVKGLGSTFRVIFQ